MLVFALGLLSASDGVCNSKGEFPGKGSYNAWKKANGFYNTGCHFFDQNKYTEALDSYKQAVSIYPYDSSYYYNMGLAFEKKKDYVSAEREYKKAIAIQPGKFHVWYNLGSVLYDLNKFDESLRAFKRASACNPTKAQSEKLKWYLDDLAKRRVLVR